MRRSNELSTLGEMHKNQAYLDERKASILVNLSGDVAVGLVRRDESGDADSAAGSKELRDLSPQPP